jgi:hypothetical protein
MKHFDTKIIGGDMDKLALPGASSEPKEGQIAVIQNKLSRYVGGQYTTLLTIRDLDDEIAGRILSKLRHWWPLDSKFQGQFMQDVHGGMDLREFTNSNNFALGPTLRTGGTASAFLASAPNGGMYIHGKPQWLLDQKSTTALSWARLSPGASTARNILIFDAPQGDGDPSYNLTLSWSFSAASYPQRSNVIWEYDAAGNDTIVTDPTGNLIPDETHMFGITVDRAAKTVQNFQDGNARTLLTYANPPLGGNGPAVKLSIGNVPTTSADPSLTTAATSGPFQGYLQDFMLFEGVLTRDEIAWLYNGGAGRSYRDVVAAANIPYNWTPAQLRRKVVWVKGDNPDNKASGGFVNSIANIAGFMPGVPYDAQDTCRFRNDIRTLNGRKVLTGTANTTALGHVIFPNTNYKRFTGVAGCFIIAVSKPTVSKTAFSVETSIVMPGSGGAVQMFAMERNVNAAGNISVGGRRVRSDAFTRGSISSSPYTGWTITVGWANYTTGRTGLRINGVAQAEAQIFSTGISESSTDAPNVVGMGGNSYNTSGRSDTEFAELIVMDTNVMDTAEMQRLEGYLAHEWGLTSVLPASHPYKTTPPLVV